jgi:tetratricopeptide (TPR) repeat protein
MAKYLLLLLLLSFQELLFSQNKLPVKNQKVEMAIDLMENGNPDEAIIMLENAKKPDPNNFIYDYEIAFAYYIKKDYKKSLAIYKKVIKYNNADDQCYQMLGNLYDINGKPQKAIDAYDEGLKKFPGSGRLYLEKGNIYWNERNLSKALTYYEKGIQVDPMFPSNYFRATLLYCNSTEKVWGMIFGEIFLNLERNSARTKEISKLLFDTYKSQITFYNKNEAEVNFCAIPNIQIKKATEIDSIKLPFGGCVYEPLMSLSAAEEKEINLNSLNRIRTKFISNYFNQYFIKYPNVLFSFNKKMLDAGQFEAYNYWLLMAGDFDSFNSWKSNNLEKWNSFIVWYTENIIQINEVNKFIKYE